MKLSVYVGLRAIAWIVSDGEKLVQHGIKRVNITPDNYYEYIAGNPVSKRINRRLKAGARRNLWRFKSRRSTLKKLLKKEFGCDYSDMTRKDILQLRVNALSKEVSKQDLTNIFLSLQLKRGYKSLRGVNDNEHSEHLKKIEMHEENLNKYKSIADYSLTLESEKNVIFLRKSYENEFEKICDAQKIEENLRRKLFSTIYYQRPLKKPKRTKCKYENKRRAHESSPLFQEFRIWRDVLNIVILHKNTNEILPISFEQKTAWVKKLENGANLSKSQCLKDLGYKNSNLFTWYSGKLIAANPIKKSFEELGIKERHYELWQDVFSATTDENLKKLLLKKYSFSDFVINAILDLDYSKFEYSDYSTKAIKKLLPLMQEGKKLKEAIFEIYGVVNFEEVSLRNVVLEQHYHSFISLIKQLETRYKFAEKVLEIDYLLKQGNKGRKDGMKNKRREEKLAKENKELSSYNLLKLRLWQESGEVSPYEPTVKISKDELFTEKYNIDHIVPKSKIFETGYTNMVICRTDLNTIKNRLTGLDFAKQLGVEEDYRACVEKIPLGKQKFLLMSEYDIPENHISKMQNSDYNTKIFCKGFLNIPNKLINKYQNEWELQKYGENDCRYYLQKAWILGNFSQETVDYFDNIKEITKKSTSLAAYKIKPVLSKIDFAKTNVFMPRIKHSRKGKNGYSPRAGLHKESVFGKRERIVYEKGLPKTKVFYKIRKPIVSLTANMVKNIIDKPLLKLIEKRIASFPSHEEALIDIAESPILFNQKIVKSVSIAINLNALIPLHSTDGKGETRKHDLYNRKIDYILPENHFCINFHTKKNQQIVSLIDYINAINKKNNVCFGKKIQRNTVLELHGELYYVLGVSKYRLTIRNLNVLSAECEISLKSDDYEHLYILHINQLGEITKRIKLIDDIAENPIIIIDETQQTNLWQSGK